MADWFRRKKTIESSREGAKERKRQRRYQRRYAKLHGYFWEPCPLCGQEFGGHEAHGFIPYTSDPNRGEGICPDCTSERMSFAEGELRNRGISALAGTSRWGFGGSVIHRVGENPTGRVGSFKYLIERPEELKADG